MEIDFLLLVEKFILIVIIILASLGIALYTTFAERKVAAILQDRPGPNRVGPFGLFQPFADGLKLIMKEDIIPTHSNKVLFVMGPIIAMSAALMTSAIIPWSSSIELFGRQINLQVTDINIGILYAFAVVSMGVYGIMIGGWASNNKFSLLAALRGASQAISYELAMGLSLVALILLTGSLSLKTIVQQQIDNNHFWNIVYQPLGFFIFFVCALAECNRAPFDMPEAESELNFGYHQEYSSMKLGFYLFAEYVNMIMSSAIMVCLYFGGYDIPFLNEQILPQNIAAILGIVAFLIKIIIFIFVFMWIRWTIPRFRYDQLMKLGWRTFIPLSLFNLLLTAFLTLYFNK